MPKLNFNNGISFGIGFGIYILLYSAVKREGKDAWGEEITTGLGKYVGEEGCCYLNDDGECIKTVKQAGDAIYLQIDQNK